MLLVPVHNIPKHVQIEADFDNFDDCALIFCLIRSACIVPYCILRKGGYLSRTQVKCFRTLTLFHNPWRGMHSLFRRRTKGAYVLSSYILAYIPTHWGDCSMTAVCNWTALLRGSLFTILTSACSEGWYVSKISRVLGDHDNGSFSRLLLAPPPGIVWFFRMEWESWFAHVPPVASVLSLDDTLVLRLLRSPTAHFTNGYTISLVWRQIWPVFEWFRPGCRRGVQFSNSLEGFIRTKKVSTVTCRMNDRAPEAQGARIVAWLAINFGVRLLVSMRGLSWFYRNMWNFVPALAPNTGSSTEDKHGKKFEIQKGIRIDPPPPIQDPTTRRVFQEDFTANKEHLSNGTYADF